MTSLEPGRRVEPKDVFLHLLSMVALYSSAVGFLVLLFQYINIIFPDSLEFNQVYELISAKSSARFSIATLIVVFPVYFFVVRFLNALYNREPEKRTLRIRKWLVYFTLFVSAIVIIGDLVSVIYNLLNGEITVRFLLKVLSVFFVAGSIFGYYLLDVRGELPKAIKYFRYGIPSVVVVAIILGFFLVGSPAKQRLIRFDERRVQDLQMVQSFITDYYTNKKTLPSTLSDLKDEVRGVSVPNDPKTGTAYEYLVLDVKNLKFSLCATFELPSQGYLETNGMGGGASLSPYYLGEEYWAHKEGRVCFERSIDPAFYDSSTKIIR